MGWPSATCGRRVRRATRKKKATCDGYKTTRSGYKMTHDGVTLSQGPLRLRTTTKGLTTGQKNAAAVRLGYDVASGNPAQCRRRRTKTLNMRRVAARFGPVARRFVAVPRRFVAVARLFGPGVQPVELSRRYPSPPSVADGARPSQAARPDRPRLGSSIMKDLFNTSEYLFCSF